MRPFEAFPEYIQQILVKLELRDKEEREKEVERKFRLRQISRETGEFLYLLVSLHNNNFNIPWRGLEIGSSGGYSTLWQGLALKNTSNGLLTSLDIDEEKVKLARDNIIQAKLQSYVQNVVADAKVYMQKLDNKSLDYVFLDAEKQDYLEYLTLLLPKMKSGALMLADNVESHKEELKEFLDFISNNNTFNNSIVSIGKGLAIIRWI